VLVFQYGEDIFREFEAGFVFRPVGQREDFVDDGRTGQFIVNLIGARQ
jgi:hypothetical protein